MLQNEDLEEDDEEFFSKLKCYCPDIYDVKYLMKSCKDLKGGLQEVSDYLQVLDSLVHSFTRSQSIANSSSM